MPRTKGGFKTHRRHKKLLTMASGFRHSRHRIYKMARDSVRKALFYGFAGRKVKKRDFRSLWITRINAAARDNGLSYSRLMAGLKNAGVALDRRVLADIALNDPKGFNQIASMAKV
jgi:large subunit ribosomal protein L20